MIDRFRKRRGVGAAGAMLAIGVSCLSAAPARGDASTANARAAALYLAVCAPAGYTTLRNEDTDSLQPGQTMDYSVTLHAGTSYCIFAAGDQWIYDLDILLYDENAKLVRSDVSRDAIPSVSVTPAWTGPFTVRIKNVRGRGAGHYAVGIAH
jgi:hypothetical protein